MLVVSLGFTALTAGCSSAADNISSEVTDRASGEISNSVSNGASNDVSDAGPDEVSTGASEEASNEVSDSIPEQPPSGDSEESSDQDSDSVADPDWLVGYAASFDSSATSELYRFANGDVELVGKVSANGADVRLTDIALAANGTIYGSSFGELFTIDPITAEAEAVATFTTGSVNALAALPDGQLLAADLGGKVSLVDPSTAEQTPLLSYPVGLTSSGDIIAMPDGTIYATASDDTVDYLVAIDISAGTAKLVLENLPHAVYGLMVSSNGDLYGLTYTSATGLCAMGEVILIDPTAGGYEPDECLAFNPGGAASD